MSTITDIAKRLGLIKSTTAKKKAPKKKAKKANGLGKPAFTNTTRSLKSRSQRELEKLGL